MRFAKTACIAFSVAAIAGLSAGCSTSVSDSSTSLHRSAGAEAGSGETAAKYVVWRIDDVPGDTGCSLDVLKSIVRAFSDTSGKVTTPLVFGIIGRTLDPDWDGKTWDGKPSPSKKISAANISAYSAYLRKLAADNPDTVEIASHSYDHPVSGGLTVMPAAKQTADLQKAQEVIKKETGVTPTSLVLPENRFNPSTNAAMKANGLTTQSAQCTWSEGGFDSEWGPWHNPS